jgi:hypothetical protein
VARHLNKRGRDFRTLAGRRPARAHSFATLPEHPLPQNQN